MDIFFYSFSRRDLIEINREMINTKSMSLAYSFKLENPNQLIEIMTEQGVFLPMDIGLEQMANIRFVYLMCHLRQIPFDIIRIDQYWFIDRIFHSELKNYFKQGDRLLIINKTMISDQLNEEDLFQLILHSSIPFLVWVTWDADTYLKYQTAAQQTMNDDAYIRAKAYLLKSCHWEKISLYDQFAFLITDTIKNSSNFRWISHYPILRSDLRRMDERDELTTMVKIHARLLEGKDRDRLKSKDYLITAVPHLMEMAHCFSSAGYGLHITEMLLIWAAMKRLDDRIHSIEMKFWGKIFGLYCDYYVVQVRHVEEILLLDQIDIMNSSSDPKRRASTKKISRDEIDSKLYPDQNIPAESHGFGANQYTYFVTTSPGLPWIKLPDVQPAAINQARNIRSLFTGCLSSNVEGFSPQLGLEKEYLRAQIARITATTYISPAGYFLLAENEGEEGEEFSDNVERKSPDEKIRRNPEFNNDPTNLITAEFLANTNLQEWVHSLPEILPQGRTQFWRSPSAQPTNFSDEEEDTEERSTPNTIEIPAPLLQPIGDDKLLHNNQHAWSIGMTMSVMHEYGLCYVRSNVWPGAVTLGHSGNYYNLYVGWGHKYEQFNPFQPPPPEREYIHEFIEINDPSVELEKKLEEAQQVLVAEFTSDDDDNEDYEETLTDEDD